MSWWQWAIVGVSVWVVGGLIASRISLHRITDERGKAKKYTTVMVYDLKCGWPLAWGLAWPFLIPLSMVMGAIYFPLWGFCKITAPVGRMLLVAASWWYTKPAVRKAKRASAIKP